MIMDEMRKRADVLPVPATANHGHDPYPISNEGNAPTTEDLQISANPFAGRLGGNQEFILPSGNPDRVKILQRTPDAAPLRSWKSSLQLQQFAEFDLWRAAIIEGWATCMLTWITCMFSVGLGAVAKELSTGPLVPNIVGNVVNAINLALFIFAAGPPSGGHINPTISIATFLLGLATLPRVVLYVLFQTAGASLGGLLTRAALGTSDV